MVTGRPAVFLDRDGVLNRPIVREGRPYPPETLEQTEILPGVVEAVERLRDRGYLAIMVTNQPDVAKGIQHRHVVESINAFVASCLELDAVKVCWCMEGEGCECYKPRPGMLIEAAAEFGIDLAASYMIGDRWRDVGAGFNAGCKTLFIECGYEETGPYCPDATVGDLPEAVDIILSGGFR